MQIDNRSQNPFELPYRAGMKNVLKNLRNPLKSISDYGWGNFLSREIIPTTLNPDKAQWAPNYFGHMIGEGMVYRKTIEWFEHHNYKHPTLFAIMIVTSSALLNEVVENGNYQGVSVDPIADLYIFEPLGILLFGFDSVEEFFSKTLNMSYWPFQPVYNPNTEEIENVGHNVIYKYQLPFSENVSMFYHYGVDGMLGLSYNIGGNRSVTVAKGLAIKDLVETGTNNSARTLTGTFVQSAGLFYDKDNSLIVSLIITPTKRYRIRLNVFPGILSYRKFSPGIFTAAGKDNDVIFGISIRLLPVGFGGVFS